MAKKKSTVRRAKRTATRKTRKTARAASRRPARRARKKPALPDPLLAPVKGAARKNFGHVRLDVGRAGAARVKRMVYPAGFRWSKDMKPEPVVMIEFDFEGDTVARLGMPDAHRHQ